MTLTVDLGVGLAGLAVDVLGHVDGELMAGGAERAALAEDVVGASAGEAVGGVAGKGLHDVFFVVAREAGEDGGGEGDVGFETRHCGWWWWW